MNSSNLTPTDRAVTDRASRRTAKTPATEPQKPFISQPKTSIALANS